MPPNPNKADWAKKTPTAGEEAERKVIEDLYKFGQRNKMPMFITYNHKFFHLIESREVGGGIENILTGEHDIMLIHRDHGAIFIQVKNIDAMRTLQKNINIAKGQLKNDVLSLEVARQNMMKDVEEDSAEDIGVSVCVIALPNVKKTQIEKRPLKDMPVPTVYLCEDDLESMDSLKQWWEENIQKRNSVFDSNTYLKLLAM